MDYQNMEIIGIVEFEYGKEFGYMKLKLVLYGAFTSLAISMLIVGFRGITRQINERDMNRPMKATVCCAALETTADVSPYQKSIAKQVLRFHVVANSDSDRDQKLKYIVRDAVLSSLQDTLRNASSVKQAKERLAPKLSDIEHTAIHTLREYGCDASVCVSVNSRYFPVKQYGKYSFPAGIYDALCIDIGTAKGQNWWCVLFPSLCFVDETTAVVPEKSQQKLQNSLSKEEYHSLISSHDFNEPTASTAPATTTPDATASADQKITEKKPKLRFGFLDFFK